MTSWGSLSKLRSNLSVLSLQSEQLGVYTELLFSRENVFLNTSNKVSCWEIVADNVDALTVVCKRASNADLSTVFPHNLCEVSGIVLQSCTSPKITLSVTTISFKAYENSTVFRNTRLLLHKPWQKFVNLTKTQLSSLQDENAKCK